MNSNRLMVASILAGLGLTLSLDPAEAAEQQMPGKCDEWSEEVEGTMQTTHIFGPEGIWYTCGTNGCHADDQPTHCHLHDHQAMD